jgi:hypothetical protein
MTRLLPQVFAQLPDRLERVLDQSSTTNDYVGLAFHSYTER